MNFETKTKIYEYFVELHKKYYKPGNLIIDTQEVIDSKEFKRIDVDYNAYVADIPITAFGLRLYKVVMKPMSPVPRYEFEELFGFGRDCKGFDLEKKVIYCPKFIVYTLEVVKTTIESYNLENMNDFIDQIENLMLYGGYVNSKKAIIEMKEFINFL
jgi:hypothetical protein